MPFSNASTRAPGAAQVDQFIRHGFIRIDEAFPAHVAEQARAILWRDSGCDPGNPVTWTRPVIRLGGYSDAPFVEAANAPPLLAAFDALVGVKRWLPRGSLGTFPLRFPSNLPPGDDGWHVDASFGTDTPDFMEWRVNFASKGRALLMLFLFSDVGPDDAPTRIRAGSHVDIARLLAPHGAAGLSLRDLAAASFATQEPREEVLATGAAGTVYLCHPFLVHAAQPHRGRHPRFMAQPPLLPAGDGVLDMADENPPPVARAILQALDG